MSNEIYTIEQLKDALNPVFHHYGVKKAILFGSYSKGIARENSDIDLLVDSNLKGLRFVGLLEDIKETTNKDIDMLDVSHIETGSIIDKEIANTGVLIYEE